MKITRVLPVLFLFFPILPSLAQESQRAIQPDTIYVGADGKFEADPDTAVIQFNIGAQEPVLKDATPGLKRPPSRSGRP